MGLAGVDAGPPGCTFPNVVDALVLSPGVDEPHAPAYHLARLLCLEVEHGDAVRGGVYQAFAVGSVAVLIEVQAGAVRLVRQTYDAMPGIGIDPRGWCISRDVNRPNSQQNRPPHHALP